MSTKAMHCNCSHAYQDAKYGKQQRVHNSKPPTSGNKVSWRCTVCGSEKGE